MSRTSKWATKFQLFATHLLKYLLLMSIKVCVFINLAIKLAYTELTEIYRDVANEQKVKIGHKITASVLIGTSGTAIFRCLLRPGGLCGSSFTRTRSRSPLLCSFRLLDLLSSSLLSSRCLRLDRLRSDSRCRRPPDLFLSWCKNNYSTLTHPLAIEVLRSTSKKTVSNKNLQVFLYFLRSIDQKYSLEQFCNYFSG